MKMLPVFPWPDGAANSKLWQCPKCKDVFVSRADLVFCSKCSDDEIATSSRMPL